MTQLARDLTREDLSQLTESMVGTLLALIADCGDEAVVFVPEDPEAFDDAAATEAEVYLPWTLGHVIVHITASAEEAAALAAELARGVAFHGRSRFEVPWEAVTTIAQCRQRLEESRRIRLASLGMWPSGDTLYRAGERFPNREAELKAKVRFLFGLMHDDSHLGQVRDIVRQASAAQKGEES